ncbi:MAG: hypothetical protein R2761_23585 [Acidimicrobiales bacterium]
MSPLINGLLLAGVGVVVTLQTWVLKEIYSIRIALTKAEARHDALDARVERVERAVLTNH